MKFKLRCEAIKEFDPQKGGYVKCNHELAVDSSQVGSLVRCPSCGNDIEVIDPSMMGAGIQPPTQSTDKDQASSDLIDIPTLAEPQTDTPKGQALEDLPPGDKGQASLNKGQASPNKGQASLDKGQAPLDKGQAFDDLVPDAKNPLKSDKNGLPPATSEEPAVDLMTELPNQKMSGMDSAAASTAFLAPASATPEGPGGELKKESYNQTSGPVLQQASFDRSNTCHKCGTLLEEKEPVCPNCKTARRAVYVDKKDRKAFSKKGPFGFQLWLDGITKRKKQEDFDWLSALSFVFSIILMGAGLTFFLFAGIAGKIVGPMVAFFGFALFTGLRYWSAARKNPRTRIPLLGKVTWTIILYLVRTMKFSKVSPEKFLNKNAEEEFGNQDLAAMKNLDQFRVIDLEGTNVTDDGLLFLYDCRGIKYLVLRNTDVSPDSVHDLQQTIPKTWIWY